jgi:pimeloyl-ACP methyl ester carboxylesterase
MTEAEIAPPLAHLEGRVPSAPAWFESALACAPERAMVDVDGAAIETLAWGARGRPGLLLLHGKMAHADWWRFIAPFFATTHRVAALSWSGMGGSGWRERYSIDTMAAEALAAAESTGLFDGPAKPIVVGHSFGGFASLRCAEGHGARLAGVVTLDMPLWSPEHRAARRPAGVRGVIAPRPTRIYPTLPDALARFRFAPPQPCENLYIADFIARGSLKEVPREEGAGNGWTWRFDPRVVELAPGDPARSLQAAACPVAIAWGGDSALVDPAVAAYIAGVAPAGTPLVEIPAARHHVMVDQPLALVAALRALLAAWPAG